MFNQIAKLTIKTNAQQKEIELMSDCIDKLITDKNYRDNVKNLKKQRIADEYENSYIDDFMCINSYNKCALFYFIKNI